MVELRRRKTKPSTEHDADNESDTDAMEPGSFSDGSSAPAKPAATHSKGENKLSKLKKRLIFGTLLLAFLCCIIAAGHLWTLALVRCHIFSLFRVRAPLTPVFILLLAQVLLTQILMFRELVNVRYNYRKFKDIPLFRTSQWGWFYACLIYSYGRSFLDPNRHALIRSRLILNCLPYVEITALLTYSTMLIITVLTFTKGYYKYQMGQLAWTMSIIVITVVQVHSFTANVLNGLFWFLFPVSLVICNDSMAYFCGMAFGRKFIKRYAQQHHHIHTLLLTPHLAPLSLYTQALPRALPKQDVGGLYWRRLLHHPLRLRHTTHLRDDAIHHLPL